MKKRPAMFLYAALLLAAFGATYFAATLRSGRTAAGMADATDPAAARNAARDAAARTASAAGAAEASIPPSTVEGTASAVHIQKVATEVGNAAMSAPDQAERAAALLRLGGMARWTDTAQTAEALRVLEVAAASDPAAQNRIRAVESIARIAHQATDSTEATLVLQRFAAHADPAVATRARMALRTLDASAPEASAGRAPDGYALTGPVVH